MLIWSFEFMHCVFIEPYFGGSHKAFAEGWIGHSRHHWTLLTLPAYKWKWRMRHGAVTFAEQIRSSSNNADVSEQRFGNTPWRAPLPRGREVTHQPEVKSRPRGSGALQDGEQAVKLNTPPDLLVCSDMLNLAEFLGLAPATWQHVPRVIYFHENQLTYPVRKTEERDTHFAFTNFISALAASEIWFNSAYHRDVFYDALQRWLKRMPDYQPTNTIPSLMEKSVVQAPGVMRPPVAPLKKNTRPHIVWAARWEHDKDPATFFRALDMLEAQGVDFQVSVIGEQFAEGRELFEAAYNRFKHRVVHWGFQKSRDDYWKVLQAADFAVSTAQHEFFGIAMVEAMAAGAFPVVPNRLAYPEVFNAQEHPEYFYAGDAKTLAQKLMERIETGGEYPGASSLMESYFWEERANEMDDRLEVLAG